MVSIWIFADHLIPRYIGVIWFVFHVLQLLRLDLHNKTHVAFNHCIR
jgi:hypothetical protein